jgi:hypothetical protein
MGVLEPVDGPAEDKDRSPDINLEHKQEASARWEVFRVSEAPRSRGL